jgi:Flp pilus assembly protein CpaB
MKNAIPLITAVLLGLAAVFAVSKTVKDADKPMERMRNVLIATSDIAAGEPIQESRVGTREVPESAIPRNAIDAAERSFTFNQKAKRPIAKGDYILYLDMDLDQSKSRALGDGQWGVPVSFADATLLRMLQPGDDIAIVGTFNYSEPVKMGKNADAEVKMVEKTVTAVIYPRVSILEINGSSVLLSMPPQQAIALTAIQRKARLYPILRKKKDDNALNRLNGGMFEDSALTSMIKGLQKIDIPLVPSEVKE